MTVILDSREDFTLDNFRRVAWQGESVAFSQNAVAKMTRAREAFMRMINDDPTQFVYGVTTEYGEGAKRRLDAEGRRKVAQRPPYFKNAGMGVRAPQRVSRGFVFTRLTNYVDGFSAITPALAQRVADKLDGRELPLVPLQGQTGAGELTPILNLVWDLIGEGCAEKDCGSLFNGAPCSPTLISDIVLRARNRFQIVARVLALSIEACNAPLEAYDPALKAMWDDEDESAALDVLNDLLAGTRTSGRRAFQAPVSWRIIPRVLGQTHRAIRNAEEVAGIALRAISDNPVYLMPDSKHPFGRAISTGGYHNGAAYPAINWLCAAWADLTGIVVRETSKLNNSAVTDLPRSLAMGENIYGVWGWAGASKSVGQSARELARTTFMPMDESGSGQDDVAVPVFDTYHKEGEVARQLDLCLAALALTASQALMVAQRQPAPKLQPFLKGVRALVPPVDKLADLGAMTETIADAFDKATLSGEFDLHSR